MLESQQPEHTAADREPANRAEIVVKGRNVAVPGHFRTYVAEKLSRLERFDPSIFLFDVELFHERNRRQRKNCQRVEITARGKGPVVRAEATADSFYAAFETMITKLESRLRRTKDRRRVHYGDKTPVSVAEATADLVDDSLPEIERDSQRNEELRTAGQTLSSSGARVPEIVEEVDYAAGPGHIVRTKVHPAAPMSVDDALYQMELVGHDFFLFQDKATDRPSVVYRRHAFDYGLIRLA